MYQIHAWPDVKNKSRSGAMSLLYAQGLPRIYIYIYICVCMYIYIYIYILEEGPPLDMLSNARMLSNLLTLPAESISNGTEKQDRALIKFWYLFCTFWYIFQPLRPLWVPLCAPCSTFSGPSGPPFSIIFAPLGPLGTLFGTTRAYLWAHGCAGVDFPPFLGCTRDPKVTCTARPRSSKHSK